MSPDAFAPQTIIYSTLWSTSASHCAVLDVVVRTFQSDKTDYFYEKDKSYEKEDTYFFSRLELLRDLIV